MNAPLQKISDVGPWVSLGRGRYRSKSTGRLRYVPHEDPEWIAAIKRLGGAP